MRTALWLAFPLNALRNGNATVFVSSTARTQLESPQNSAILNLSFPCALKRELHSRQTGTAAILSLNGCALRELTWLRHASRTVDTRRRPTYLNRVVEKGTRLKRVTCSAPVEQADRSL